MIAFEIFSGLRVLSTIEFDDQPTVVTDKIDNETSDRCLTSKTQSHQTMGAQCLPQSHFGICHFMAQILRMAAMNRRYLAMGGLLATPLPDRFAVRPPPQGGR
jgi:hypothetical protein